MRVRVTSLSQVPHWLIIMPITIRAMRIRRVLELAKDTLYPRDDFAIYRLRALLDLYVGE